MESIFGMEEKFATAVPKHYGECSDMLVFLLEKSKGDGKKGTAKNLSFRRTVLGSSRGPCYQRDLPKQRICLLIGCLLIVC